MKMIKKEKKKKKNKGKIYLHNQRTFPACDAIKFQLKTKLFFLETKTLLTKQNENLIR
jgi:hypothetical protein